MHPPPYNLQETENNEDLRSKLTVAEQRLHTAKSKRKPAL